MGAELPWCSIASSRIALAATARTPKSPYPWKSRATYALSASQLSACLHAMCRLAGLGNASFSVEGKEGRWRREFGNLSPKELSREDQCIHIRLAGNQHHSPRFSMHHLCQLLHQHVWDSYLVSIISEPSSMSRCTRVKGS